MIKVFSKSEKNIPQGFTLVDTTSYGPFKDLSPFYLGPYSWNDPAFGVLTAKRFENLWQYSKVYPVHCDYGTDGIVHSVLPTYFDWRAEGFTKDRAERYPMGKGVKPVFSLWKHQVLDYIPARNEIYIPIYKELVLKTPSYAKLYKWTQMGTNIALIDFDGYDHESMGMTLIDVINNPKRPMGHAFIIYGLLTGQL